MGESTPRNAGAGMDKEYPVPTVVERTPLGEREYDIYSMLVKNRVVFIGSPIDMAVADLVVAELLVLQQQDPERDIAVYVNSPGGELDAGLAIYDAMHLVRPPVATTCVGTAIGIAALLVAAGTRGRRAALPNARLMIHQPSTEVVGAAADIDVRAREIVRMNARLTELLATDSGQPVERVAHDMNRDFWLSAEEAVSYGLVDTVLGRAP